MVRERFLTYINTNDVFLRDGVPRLGVPRIESSFPREFVEKEFDIRISIFGPVPKGAFIYLFWYI